MGVKERGAVGVARGVRGKRYIPLTGSSLCGLTVWLLFKIKDVCN